MIDELYVMMFELTSGGMLLWLMIQRCDCTNMAGGPAYLRTKRKDLGHLPSMNHYVNDSIYSNTILDFFCGYLGIGLYQYNIDVSTKFKFLCVKSTYPLYIYSTNYMFAG